MSMIVKVTSRQVWYAVYAAIEGVRAQRAGGTTYDAIAGFRRIAALLGVDLDENGGPMETTVTRRTLDGFGVALEGDDGSDRD